MPMIYHDISRQCSIIFLFLNVLKNRSHCIRVDSAFTEKTCNSWNLKLCMDTYVLVKKTNCICCVFCMCMCASAHVSMCIYRPHSQSRLD